MQNEEKEYSLVMPPIAEQELEECFYYISYRLNAPKAAKDLSNKFRQGFNRICKFPESCKECVDDLFCYKNYRKLIIDNYIALYRINEKDKEIIIIHIFYAPSNYIEKI